MGNNDTEDDDDDSGKTLMSVLIVCPKSVLGVWESELQEWLENNDNDNDDRLSWTIQIVTASRGKSYTPNFHPPPRLLSSSSSSSSFAHGFITIINYDVCFKYQDDLQSIKYDVLICDEAHYLKSRKTQRTLAILGDGSKKFPGIAAKYLWLLTGTPVLNRPVELYPLLRALSPQEFGGSFSAFAQRYCDPKPVIRRPGRGGGMTTTTTMDYSGASNLAELSNRLQPFMLRRYKADLLTQLPPKFRSCVCLTTTSRNAATATQIAQQERERLAQVLGVNALSSSSSLLLPPLPSRQNLESFGLDADPLLSYIQNVTRRRRRSGNDDDDDRSDEEIMGAITAVRKETALIKLEPAIELLENIILSEKVVVFCHHRDLIGQLLEHFGPSRAVHVMGGMSMEERMESVRRFQQEDDVRMFLGSIRAAGVGLTLTAASHVVFLELDWSPGVMAQAEDRCHRVGQERSSVQVQYFVFKGTLDEWIANSLLTKQFHINQILTDERRSRTSKESVNANDDSSVDPMGNAAATTKSNNNYLLNFGKYQGLRLDDVPPTYLHFLVKRQVWRNRLDLWRALAQKGIVSEPPPLPEETDRMATPDDDDPESRNNRKVSTQSWDTLDESIVTVPPSLDDDNGDKREMTGEVGVHNEYVFDFGKHNGKKWDDVPQGYKDWLLRERVWKNRKTLREAFVRLGYSLEKEAEMVTGNAD